MSQVTKPRFFQGPWGDFGESGFICIFRRGESQKNRGAHTRPPGNLRRPLRPIYFAYFAAAFLASSCSRIRLSMAGAGLSGRHLVSSGGSGHS